MAKLIETYFANKVLPIKYQNEYLSSTLGSVRLFDLSERVINNHDNYTFAKIK